MKIVSKERVEIDVRAQPQPIIGVDKVQIRAVFDVYIPAHRAHLQTKNSRDATLIQKEEFHSKTIRHPDKVLSKYIILHFVDGVISSVAFAEVRVKPHLVTAAFAGPETNWVEDCCGLPCHEKKAFLSL